VFVRWLLVTAGCCSADRRAGAEAAGRWRPPIARACRSGPGNAARGRQRHRRGARDDARADRRRAAIELGHRRRRASSSTMTAGRNRDRAPSTAAKPPRRSASARSLFLDADGKPHPLRSLAVPGGKSVGVPGNVALLAKGASRAGASCPGRNCSSPAIRLARTRASRFNPILAGQSIAAMQPHDGTDFPEARAHLLDRWPAAARRHNDPQSGAGRYAAKRIAARGPDSLLQGR
jgi:hypothetical protein